MNRVDLFPVCPLDPCAVPDPILVGEGEHKHILPHQKLFLDSDAKYLALVGGYGGAKTLPASILCVQLLLSIPGNMGIVCRRSYAKLHDSTERIFLEVLQRACQKQGISILRREMRDSWPHRLILEETGAEVVFRETKDLGRFLGPEYGFFFIDEAAEEPRKTFTDLVGRLRLQRAVPYLRGILASNPPNAQHWLAEFFGTDTGRREVGGSTYEQIRISSRINPFLPEDYLSDLAVTHSLAEVARIVEGRYGFVADGTPVYSPPFDAAKHVTDRDVVSGLTLVRAWDFGFRCPAVTWHQFPRCEKGRTHWIVLREKLGKNIEAEPFADEVIQETAQQFPTISRQLIMDCGDSAGRNRTDRGPGPMMRLAEPPRSLTFRYRHIRNVDPSLDLVRTALRTICACGKPLKQIHRRCRSYIDGMAGGYHYSSDRPSRPPDEKPKKDGYYDNVMDTGRYAGECFFRESTYSSPPRDFVREAFENSWDWMGAWGR